MCQEFGLEPDNPAIPKIAYGFAGGIGNSGDVCGAVVGGVMAIGLKLGRGDSMEGMMQNLGVAREFRRRFKEEMGETECRELTGLDLTKDQDMAELMNSDVPQNVCFPAVATAYRLAVELLKETEQARTDD
ncbi:MAG: C_GCAxxG_C_C family protein [Candidatus Eisenbacteria bacterium]|nr:C_GCAxxG_C_C family protein [Candidatus Eisenbacteria bacterium]